MTAGALQYVTFATLLMASVNGIAQTKPETTAKAVLLEQLRNTHTTQAWFVPAQKALDGLTAAQAQWKDSTENHSIAELVSHLVFWNEMNLKVFKGEDVQEFKEDNKVTFKAYGNMEWDSLRLQLDRVQTEWEYLMENATAVQLAEWGVEIANMASHTAYHLGQIVFIRKRKGWWD